MKRVSATHAKSHFGELLEDVAALGRVEIVKHGRIVAIVLSPRVNGEKRSGNTRESPSWTRTHMIPPALARAARVERTPVDFGDDWA